MKHHCAATPVAAFFFAVVATFGAPAARASTRVGIDPLQLVLPPRALTDSVNLTNKSKKPATFQVELLAWTQVDGQDVLTPSNDLIVAPPIFSVPADGRQTVRVGRLQRVAPGPVEKTYRLAITEIPDESQARPEAVTTALRITLPVFITPANPTPPTFIWQASPGPDGLTMNVVNTGNTTVRMTRVALRRGAEILATRPLQLTVLPGATRTVLWPDLPARLVDGALDIQTELNTQRKITLPLTFRPLPASAPGALPSSLVTPTTAAVSTAAPTPRP